MYMPFAQIEPTTKCNYTCGFCAGRKMKQQDLPLDVFRNFIDQVEGLEYLELQGEGEPLLHSGFFDMVCYAKNKFSELHISMITNGSMFTQENIKRLIDFGVARIFVSMESADDVVFQKVRGGTLDKVKRGVRNLLKERNDRQSDKPVVGLAVTVLKSTIFEPTGTIVEFYKEFDLDGGIIMQALQSMPQYTRFYSGRISSDMLQKDDRQVLNKCISKSRDLQKALQDRRQQPGFYDYLYRSVNTHSHCPWLANAIYLSASGHLVPCCHIKDYQKDNIGTLGGADVQGIFQSRRLMQKQLGQGKIPNACQGCSLALGIARNVSLQP